MPQTITRKDQARSRYALLTLIIISLAGSNLLAQENELPARRNIIKVDVTSHVWYRNAMIFSYERVTKPNQSFVISGGYNQFPQMVSLGDNIRTTEDLKRTGFKIGGEYRFYLAKENKYPAPRGVYIGPYASYLNFSNERNLEITPEEGEIKTAFFSSDISVLNIGFQVGYQFVLNNRWTIDIIFIGPSVSRYGAKLKIDGDFDIDEEELYQNEIVQKLISRFPMFDDLIQDQEVNVDGTTSSWSFGYRYQVLVGYHFGRKK